MKHLLNELVYFIHPRKIGGMTNINKIQERPATNDKQTYGLNANGFALRTIEIVGAACKLFKVHIFATNHNSWLHDNVLTANQI